MKQHDSLLWLSKPQVFNKVSVQCSDMQYISQLVAYL